MRLRQIEIFYHVYRVGSISGAARVLNVSQPSVSKVLRYAEDQLGFKLFVREKGRLRSTAEADELYSEVRDIYERISAFDRTAHNIKHRKGGHVRLGILPSLSLSVLPTAIAQIQRNQTNVSFELRTVHSEEIEGALLEKRCDICIGYRQATINGVSTEKLGTGRLVLVSNQEITVGPKGVGLACLNDMEYIGIKDSGPLASMLTSAFDEHDIDPIEVVTTHTYHVALALVRKDVGIAVVDEFTANSYLGADLFRYPINEIPPFSVYSARLKDHPQSDFIDQTVQEVRTAIGKF
jgi:DNA-binding transcriptional LysR family regulator